MLRLRLTFLLPVLLSPAAAGAQDAARYDGVGLSVGPAIVGAASRFIAASQAPHLELTTARSISPALVISFGFDAFLMGSIVSEPLCAPDPSSSVAPSCESRTERAGALLGLTMETRWYPWRNGLGMSAGIGAYYAPSVHGPVSSTGMSLSAGAEYLLSTRATGTRPVIGVRGSRLLSDVGGIRWVISPTFGLRF